MTILNIHIEKDLAVIAANTEVIVTSGASQCAGHAGKIFPVPEKNVVVCGRGLTGLLFNAFAWAHSSSRDFDGLAEEWEDALGAIVGHTFDQARSLGASQPSITRLLRSELMLVGRSRARDTMACFHAAVSEEGSIEVCEVFGAVVPWIWGEHPATQGSVEWMTAMARRQSELASRDCPGKAWHGDLTVTRLAVDSIELTTVREFWRAP